MFYILELKFLLNAIDFLGTTLLGQLQPWELFSHKAEQLKILQFTTCSAEVALTLDSILVKVRAAWWNRKNPYQGCDECSLLKSSIRTFTSVLYSVSTSNLNSCSLCLVCDKLWQCCCRWIHVDYVFVSANITRHNVYHDHPLTSHPASLAWSLSLFLFLASSINTLLSLFALCYDALCWVPTAPGLEIPSPPDGPKLLW